MPHNTNFWRSPLRARVTKQNLIFVGELINLLMTCPASLPRFPALSSCSIRLFLAEQPQTRRQQAWGWLSSPGPL